MKYLAILSLSMLLVGAGCTTATNVSDTTTDLNAPTQKSTTTTNETVRTETTIIEDGKVRAKTDITADVATTVDCGDQDCFDAKFAACEPATMTSDSGWAGVTYTIVGPVTGGCSMTMSYPTNPNPEWVNKPMTCTFNNSLELTAAVQEQLNAIGKSGGTCTGPLVDVIQGS